MFDGSSQKAYAADDIEYSTDGAAAAYAKKNAETFLDDIDPGNQVTGVIVFDIPKGVKLTKLELHDSPFSCRRPWRWPAAQRCGEWRPAR
ncbi:DUF4352 domain-containing protein [Micromonospora echinospora]|uniref:DUF4352 domain-containing protein n=1 Tax=Micromonospora echinospora TaxID=1877 RepID=UPI0033C3CCF7